MEDVTSGSQRGCRGNPVNLQSKPEQTGCPVGASWVDLEDRAVSQDSRIVIRTIPVAFGAEDQPEVAVEPAALFQSRRIQHEQADAACFWPCHGTSPVVGLSRSLSRLTM